MGPPPPIVIDAQVISGITGSISIACWIIVFAPQIYENFRRKSSEGLSMMFIILWLAGDVFNVLGAVLQGVLPTMIILAIYYTLADIVLWVQCIIYGDGKSSPDYVHLSPANPINEDVLETVLSADRAIQCSDLDSARGEIDEFEISLKTSPIMSAFFKMLMVILVFLAGLGGWYISYMNTSRKHKAPVDLVFDPLAQFFGWLCALFYLGSRIPQILLNYERKSCDGISFMFFLFACLGNLTYVISILAIDTSWNYIWVNLSWLAGSLGTLALDFTIFVQFFLYNEGVDDDESSSLTNSTNTNSGEQLLSGRSEGYGTV
uniref:PQ-loop-domain-containing protein n=1 Tax=Candidozyma auris TaxID=498019 RepID=A0A0L0NP84_CANAR